MAKRFEIHLEGMDAPEGLIDADRLIEIVRSLQDIATRLGRIQTESADRGRPSKLLERVAGLRIGLEKGSTTIIAERDVADGALDLDLSDELAVDEKFEALIEGIAADVRPAWVTASVASAADSFVNALRRTAPMVQFAINGETSATFQTEHIHRETWKSSPTSPSQADVAFTGRLFAVNLHTHYFQMQDDVGNKVALPKVLDDAVAARLVGSYVTATGAPGLDSQGRLRSPGHPLTWRATRSTGSLQPRV
jgi:hypothetical protein